MAFDFAWDWRGTLAYVTDPTYASFEGASAYPHTYTNVDGLSINGGWTNMFGGGSNRDATNDPRIAGECELATNNDNANFSVDLSSGSAPGTGDYAVDVACGDAANSSKQDFKLKDTTTVLIDGTNGGAGYPIVADHYIDATLAEVTATTTWTGTPATVTFATTLVKLNLGVSNCGGATHLAHFRLTLQQPNAYVLVCTPRPTPT